MRLAASVAFGRLHIVPRLGRFFERYPDGYLLIALPLAKRVAGVVGLKDLPWPITAFGYGVGLWVFALYVMAHVFAGLPPFLGFITLTWASLVGHVIFSLVLGAVVALRR